MNSILLAAAGGGTFWLPERASTFVGDVDGLFYLIYWLCVIFFVPMMGVMVYFAHKYKKRGDDDKTHPIKGHHKLEIAWSAIPGAILLVVFAWGFMGYVKMKVPPNNAEEIRVIGAMWSWSFQYPNGGNDSRLVVPVDQPIQLTMSSVDVLHSFYVPAFRVKRDVLPNRYTVIWFEATEPGTYHVFCTEYCGRSHSDMITTVEVVSREAYEEYLDGLAGCGEDQTLAECGEVVYSRAGCNACHSVDGSRIVGPSFAGIYGEEHTMESGATVTVDQDYLRESILEPNAQVVAGYPAAMPTYQGRLSEEEINALIAYIESLGE